MNSRERVLAALNHQQPDRVPVDLSAHRSSGIAAIAYAKLKKALGITSGNIYVYDIVQQLAIVEPEVLDALNIDVVEMGRGFMTDDKEWKDWTLPDGTACKIPYFLNIEKHDDDWFLYADNGTELAVQKKGCLYFEQTNWPLMKRGIENDDFSDLEEQLKYTMWTGIPTPGCHFPLNEQGLKKLKDGAKKFRESTDRAIIGGFGGSLFELPQFLYRNDNFMMYMGLYPEKVLELMERICDMHLKNMEKWLGAVGPYIDIILFGDDFGGQNGPLISPAMYRQYFKPYKKKMWIRAKELADVKIQTHCCGGIRELLPDMIDAGLEAINPVQITCQGMDAAGLKADFGDQITFWGGGCDTREILGNTTPAKVKKHVKKQIKILNQGGGFVFQQVHNIMANVPPKNILAMYEAIKESW